ncbi:hypothetical protein E0H73_26815 [Kribbella pittospori]|uniref:Uncharacterized protein n=1 Tax=Kribbella pittospori TaxID=722689 RepID=A0A4R0KJ14_9ACTN|nr:hypothetical protein [Kribbella pittospori]TCC57968.1 hypothetical protein E0H73_26815 [Kribbella pittospori]
MTESGGDERSSLVTSPSNGSAASPGERAIAALIGCVTAAAGALAVFWTENEVGSGALLLIGAAFLAMATFGLVPVRFKVGDKEMEVGRAALRTLEDVLRESDAATQDKVIDAFEGELEARGVTREPGDAVDAMLSRFERYAGSRNPRTVHDYLLASGWQPFTPGKSTYIRWVYNGKAHSVSLFQNSGTLTAASVQVRDYARTLEGADRGPKDEALFVYAVDPSPAMGAADSIRRFADTTS